MGFDSYSRTWRILELQLHPPLLINEDTIRRNSENLTMECLDNGGPLDSLPVTIGYGITRPVYVCFYASWGKNCETTMRSEAFLDRFSAHRRICRGLFVTEN